MRTLKFVVFTLCVVAMGVAEANDDADGKYWTRLNYGLAAIRVKQVCVAEGYWHHTVHLTLPKVPDSGLPGRPNATKRWCDEPCTSLKGLLWATRTLVVTMQESIRKTIDKISELVPDATGPLKTPRGRVTRAWFEFLGVASSFLFGTATTGDINELKEMIKKVEATAETGAADSAAFVRDWPNTRSCRTKEWTI